MFPHKNEPNWGRIMEDTAQGGVQFATNGNQSSVAVNLERRTGVARRSVDAITVQKSPRKRKNYVPVKVVKIPKHEEEQLNGYRWDDEDEDDDDSAIAPEQGLPPLSEPTADRLQCDQEASQMVHDANLALGDQAVKNPKLNDLIASLTSLMLQIKSLAKNDMNSYGFKSLNESLEEIKKKIDPKNLRCFQDNVEVHIAHIQSGMSQMGNLHAFAEKSTHY